MTTLLNLITQAIELHQRVRLPNPCDDDLQYARNFQSLHLYLGFSVNVAPSLPDICKAHTPSILVVHTDEELKTQTELANNKYDVIQVRDLLHGHRPLGVHAYIFVAAPVNAQEQLSVYRMLTRPGLDQTFVFLGQDQYFTLLG